MKTSAQSWAESDLALKGPIKFDEGKDRMGPISLAAVATVKGPPPPRRPPRRPRPPRAPEEPKAPEGRVVAVGDADFASNSLLGFQGNQDFFLNAAPSSARGRPRAGSSRSATPTSPRTRSSASRATRTSS